MQPALYDIVHSASKTRWPPLTPRQRPRQENDSQSFIYIEAIPWDEAKGAVVQHRQRDIDRGEVSVGS